MVIIPCESAFTANESYSGLVIHWGKKVIMIFESITLTVLKIRLPMSKIGQKVGVQAITTAWRSMFRDRNMADALDKGW